MTLSSRLRVPTRIPAFLLFVALPLATLVAQPTNGTDVSLPHTSRTHCLGFDGTEKYFVTQSYGHVAVWNVETGKQVLREKAESQSCKISKDRRELLFVQKREGQHRLFRYKIGGATPAASYLIPDEINPESFCFSHNKHYLLAAYAWRKDTPEQVFLLDRQSLKPLPESQQPQPLSVHKFNLEQRIRYLNEIQTELGVASLTPVEGWIFLQHEITPDGRFLYQEHWPDSGEKTTFIKMFDISDGTAFYEHESSYLANRDFSLHPSKPIFAVGSGQQSVKVLSSNDGILIRELPSLGQNIQDLSFTPDGKHIIALTDEGLLAGWNAEDYQPLPRRQLNFKTKMLTFDASGQIYVTGTKTVRLASLEDPGTLLSKSSCETIDVSSNGRHIVLGNQHSQTSLFLAEGTEEDPLKKTVTLASTRRQDLHFSPDGSAAIAVNAPPGDPAPVLLDISAGKLLRTFPPESVNHRANLPDTPRPASVTSANSSQGHAEISRRSSRVRDFQEDFRIDAVGPIDSPSDVAKRWWPQFTTAGLSKPLAGPQLVYRDERNGKLNLLGAYSYNEVRQFEAGDPAHGYHIGDMVMTAAASSGQGDRLFVAFRQKHREGKANLVIGEFSTSNGRLLHQYNVTQPDYSGTWSAESLRLSPDERFLGICFSYEMAILDLQNGQLALVGREGGGSKDREFVEFDTHSKFAVFHGHKKTLWDIRKGQPVRELGYYNTVKNILFSPNGKHLLIDTGNWSPTLIRSYDGEAIRQFPQNTDIHFSPDGSCLMACSHQELQLWDFDDGKRLFKPEPPESRTQYCERSAAVHFFDGGRVAVLLESDSDGNLVVSKAERSSGKVLDRLEIPTLIDQGWFPSHTQLIANNRLLANTSNELWVMDLSPLAVKQRFPISTRPPQRPIYCQSEDAVLIQMEDAAELRAADSGELIRAFENVEGSLAFSEDESRLIARFRNGHSIRTWDTQTGELLKTIHTDLLREEATSSP